MKKIILNYLYKLIISNLRQLKPHQLRHLKSRLHAFNASCNKWDSPNVRKQNNAEAEQ